MIGQEPSFGYRTVAWLPGFNRNTVQRVFQLRGWQVRKRRWECVPASRRSRPWQQPRTSAGRPICAVSGRGEMGGARWLDHARPGHRLPHPPGVGLVSVTLRQSHDRRQRAGACADHRIRHPGPVPAEFLPRSDNGPDFTSRKFTALVRSCGLKQAFIIPPSPAGSNRWPLRWLDPQQNGMVKRVIRTLKEQCVHRQGFDSIQHTTRAIGDWISLCNNRPPSDVCHAPARRGIQIGSST